LLGAAIRVEPALLRAVRYLLPARQVDVGSEAAAWNHSQVHATSLAFYYEQDAIRTYRAAFALQPQSLRQQVAALIAAHHASLSPVIGHEEQWLLAQADEKSTAPVTQGLLANLVKMLHHMSFEAGYAWLQRMVRRQHQQMWDDEVLAAAWATLHLDDISAGKRVDPPEGIDLARLGWLFKQGAEAGTYILRQRGPHLYIESETLPRTATGLEIPGSPLSLVRATSRYVQVQVIGADGTPASVFWQPLEQRLALPAEGSLRLRTDHQELTMDSIVRPGWADGLGCDVHGLYASINVHGVEQRLRWMAPGEFTMGSPQDEPGRRDDEIQHPVILTRGFWLAETTCPQELWQVVMGRNPSVFRGNDRPVEQVSWADVQHFLVQLNRIVPGGGFRLPMEAEWEYACRASITTAFWFGNQITPELVNYDGNYPHVGGERGVCRGKTVPVKALPCNSWGLYQMHGNVWEWCQDWYGGYPTEMVIDPTGPTRGAARVLRGGSWINHGSHARAAQRYACAPRDRLAGLGFRLARGQVMAEPVPETEEKTMKYRFFS
jgi:formylglycine-generating enzyme required for sulfatase activity